MPDFAFAANPTPDRHLLGMDHVLFVKTHRRAISGRLRGYLRQNYVMLTRLLRVILVFSYLTENTS